MALEIMKTLKEFTSKSFKKELEDVMPKYKWKIQRTTGNDRLLAMGIMSSGSNRTATLFVKRTIDKTSYGVVYTAKADTNFAWTDYEKIACSDLLYGVGVTLKQSLRDLQKSHEKIAEYHSSIVFTLQRARKNTDD